MQLTKEEIVEQIKGLADSKKCIKLRGINLQGYYIDLSELEAEEIYNNVQKAKYISNNYQQANHIDNNDQEATDIWNRNQKSKRIHNHEQTAKYIYNDSQEAKYIYNDSQEANSIYNRDQIIVESPDEIWNSLTEEQKKELLKNK